MRANCVLTPENERTAYIPPDGKPCGGVPPGNGLGENAGSAIGKALEKNTALAKLHLSGAPACVLALRLSSVYFSRLCASVFTRLLSIRPVSCVLLQVRCMLMCGSGGDRSRLRSRDSDLVGLVGVSIVVCCGACARVVRVWSRL